MRIMGVIFDENSCFTIVSCYTSIIVSDETDLTTFYNELYSLELHVPKHNFLIINGDRKAKMEIVEFVYSTPQTEMLKI